MDKIKSIMGHGNKKDEAAVADQSGTSGLSQNRSTTGEGSHFGSSRTADPTSSSSYPTSATGSNVTGTGSHGLSEPHSSQMPGRFDDDDAATTASVSSGIPGKAQGGHTSGLAGSGTDSTLNKTLPDAPSSNTGSSLGGSNLASNSGLNTDRSFPLGGNDTSNYAPGQTGTYKAGGMAPGSSTSTTSNSGLGSSTTAGPHSSNLANKADPRVDSDLDGRSGLGNSSSLGSSGGYSSTTAPTTGSSHQGHLGRDTAVGTGSVGTASTTVGPHSSNLANKADPRVDSDLDGRRGLGNSSSLGSTTATTTGTAPTTGAPHQGSHGGLGAGYGPESWEHQHGTHGHQYSGDPCGNETAASGAPHFTHGPHATDTANRLDPRVGSGIGAPASTTGVSSSAFGSSSTSTAGPHSSNLLNKADPRVDSDMDGKNALNNRGTSNTTSTSGLGSTSSTSHTGRDTAIGATALGATAGVGSHERGIGGSTGPAPTTAGPHKSDMLNKLDPRVDSDLSKQQSGSTGLGSSTAGNTSNDHHHYGRDAGLAGGAVGAYETEKHHHDKHHPTGTASTGSTVGTSSSPYSSSNVDSRIDGPRSNIGSSSTDHHYGRDAGIAGGAGAAGIGAYEAEKHHHNNQHGPASTSSTTGHHSHPTQAGTTSGFEPTRSGYDDRMGTGHHYGRDAGLTGGAGAGAAGVGAYEAQKHLGHHDQPAEQLAGSSYQPSSSNTTTSRDPSEKHHLGRDTAIGAGVGGTAYEAEKHHHHKQHDPTSASGSNTQHHLGRDTAVGAGVGGTAYEAEKHHHNKQHDPTSASGSNTQHHLGRDTAVGAGVGGTAYEAEKHHHNKQHDATSASGINTSRDPSDKHHLGRDAAIGAGVGGTAYEAEKHHHNRHEPTSTSGVHGSQGGYPDQTGYTGRGQNVTATGRDGALATGTGVAAAHGIHDERDAKKLYNDQAKEQRREEKAERKEEKREEKHDGKKHGGILGLFHRDKPDKDLKEDELRRQAETETTTTHGHRHGEGLATGAGATGLEHEMQKTGLNDRDQTMAGQGMTGQGMQGQNLTGTGGEYGGQAGLQDSAISSGSGIGGVGSGPTTHDAYGSHDPNKHNKLHKDPAGL